MLSQQQRQQRSTASGSLSTTQAHARLAPYNLRPSCQPFSAVIRSQYAGAFTATQQQRGTTAPSP
jgi:hypothetical protein